MQAQINLSQAADKSAYDMAKIEVERFNAETKRMEAEAEIAREQRESADKAREHELKEAEVMPTVKANQNLEALTTALATQAQAAILPKVKQGTMVRNPDGSYSMTVVEGVA